MIKFTVCVYMLKGQDYAIQYRRLKLQNDASSLSETGSFVPDMTISLKNLIIDNYTIPVLLHFSSVEWNM